MDVFRSKLAHNNRKNLSGKKCRSKLRFSFQAFEPDWTSSTLSWQVNLATIANPFIQWPVWKAIHRYG
jgi:hypothetical protein